MKIKSLSLHSPDAVDYPLRPYDHTSQQAETPGEIDPVASPGTIIDSRGRAVCAPVADCSDVASRRGAVADRPLAERPSMPGVEWALTRAQCPGWQQTPWQIPSATLHIDIDSIETEAVAAFIAGEGQRVPRGGHWRSLVARAGHDLLQRWYSDCRAEGLFAVPFLALAVLRMKDGSRTLASPPVLLQPVDASPLAHVAAARLEGNVLRLEVSLVSAPCSLSVRFDRIADSATLDCAEAVELHVGGMADLTALPGTDGILYQAVDINSRSGLDTAPGSPNRPSVLAAASVPLWCIDAGRATQASVSAALARCSSFSRIAEIPVGNLPQEWAEVTVSPGALDAEPDFTPDYSLLQTLSGGTLRRTGGIVAVAGAQFTPPPTLPSAQTVQYDDRGEGAAPDVSWVFVPDPSARSYAVGSRVFPLHRHATLYGAYWHGTTNDGHMVANPSFPERQAGLAVACSGHEALFPLSRRTFWPEGVEVTGVAEAVRSMSSGELGRFPLYALTTAGVWALSPDGTGGWKGVQAVSRLVCAGRDLYAEAGRGVALVASGSLWLLEGSSETLLVPSGCLESFGQGEVTALAPGRDHTQLLVAFRSGAVLVFDLVRGRFAGRAADGEAVHRLTLRPFAVPDGLRQVTLRGNPGADSLLAITAFWPGGGRRCLAAAPGLTVAGLSLCGVPRAGVSLAVHPNGLW